MDSDLERFVIACAQKGSRQAWQQLFDWHFDAVFAFCRKLAGGRQDWAQEMSQQAFITAARRIDRFDPQQGALRAWLFGIARNCHAAMTAAETRRRRREALALPRQPDEPPDLGVHEALAQLPQRYRAVLEAKYLRQLTLAEIAQADGQSVEAVESLLRRARRRFAEVYEEHSE